MKGIGRTVFSGQKVEEFQVEILGTIENMGPKQSLILGRLSGGPLAQTGVMQGMSGSPVYINGKLIGAVAMAFPFAKEPIAGIRPIEEMLDVNIQTQRAALDLVSPNSPPPPSKVNEVKFGQSKLIDIATPINFGGFTRNTIEQFTPALRALGFEPMQGVASGGRPAAAPATITPATLEPGSMISVQLLSGDLSAGADGTVTHIDGNRIYAFGHRFLSIGETELPFAKAEVLTLLPNLSSSFKISSARQWLGTITQDRNTAIAGQLGKMATLVPININVNAPRKNYNYKINMANDRFLTPFMLQMAVFSSLDATERGIGAATFRLRGEIQFNGAKAPIRLDNMYAGDFGTPLITALGAASPVAYALQSGFSELKLSKIDLTIDVYEQKKQYQIESVFPSRPVVRPGEAVDIFVVMGGEDGGEITRKVEYKVPVGAPTGLLYFSVADGFVANAAESRQLTGGTAKTSSQIITYLNSMRKNTSAWVRVWRADQNYQVQGEDMPAPPPSLAMLLQRSQSTPGNPVLSRGSKVAELEIPLGDAVVSGSRTVQVEVKE